MFLWLMIYKIRFILELYEVNLILIMVIILLNFVWYDKENYKNKNIREDVNKWCLLFFY